MEPLFISFLIGYTFRDDNVHDSFREEMVTRLHAEAENESLYSCAGELNKVKQELNVIIKGLIAQSADLIKDCDFVTLYYAAKMTNITNKRQFDKIVKDSVFSGKIVRNNLD